MQRQSLLRDEDGDEDEDERYTEVSPHRERGTMQSGKVQHAVVAEEMKRFKIDVEVQLIIRY